MSKQENERESSKGPSKSTEREEKIAQEERDFSNSGPGAPATGNPGTGTDAGKYED